MQAIATTLAIVLLSSTAAKAFPAVASTAAKDDAGGSGFAAELAAATTVDANGDPHLYFRTQYKPIGWCGEIDAAPFMPAKLFEPRHFLSLLKYVIANPGMELPPMPPLPPRSTFTLEIRQGWTFAQQRWTP